MARLSAILERINGGTMLLPVFQRGYVWVDLPDHMLDVIRTFSPSAAQ